GVLVDQLHGGAELTQPPAGAELGDLGTADEDVAGGGAAEGGDRSAGGGLAGAGFPHQGMGGAAGDVEGEVMDREEGFGAAGTGALLAEAAHLHQGCFVW